MKSRMAILPVLFSIIAAGLVSCNLGSQDSTTQQFVEVERGNLTVTVSGSGNLEAINSRKLSFGAAGEIESIYVHEGQEVTKGDRIVSLVSSALELNVAQSELALTQAESGVAQAEVGVKSAELALNQAENQLNTLLIDTDTEEVALLRLQLEAAQQSLDAADQSKSLAEQVLEEARRQLEATTLRAPFDGIVARLNVKEGEMTSPALPVAEIIDPREMQFEIQVDEIDVVAVKPGQIAEIEVDALPDLALEGEVTFISDLPSPQTGVVVYIARISLEVPRDSGLKVGMSAAADIVITERENVLLIPDRAISKNDQGETVVTIQEDGVNRVKVISAGVTDGIMTEVLDGLQEGDIVVVEKASQFPGGLF